MTNLLFVVYEFILYISIFALLLAAHLIFGEGNCGFIVFIDIYLSIRHQEIV